jgi:xanthine dehydrogenase YagT iron-sulfur-binding subunit
MIEEIKADWPSALTDDVAAKPVISDDELRERMSGNLCRCGAYDNIISAIKDAMDQGVAS